MAPLVSRKQIRRSGNTRFTRMVLPRLIPPGLQEDGRLRYSNDFANSWIPRTLLEPSSSDVVIGDQESMESYLEANILELSDDPIENWQTVLSYSFSLLEFVS